MRLFFPLLVLTAACARSDERWIEALDDPDPFERALAAFALCEQAPERAPLTLGVLLETVDRSELELGAHAARHLELLARSIPDSLRARLAANPLMTEARRRAIEDALRGAGRGRR